MNNPLDILLVVLTLAMFGMCFFGLMWVLIEWVRFEIRCNREDREMRHD